MQKLKPKDATDNNINTSVPEAKVSIVESVAGVLKSEKLTAEQVGEVGVYDQPTCNIGFSGGVTRNSGNYNSTKVSVSLNMPCYPTELEEVYGFVKEWVDNKLSEVVAELDSDT